MSCAICGKDNQPGTRFCVHCGAALAPVTTSPMVGGAALTSATATAARPAPHGVPTQPMPPAAESKVRPAEPAPSIPAYDSGDRKTGPPYVLIGALALLAIAAAIGYKIFGGVTDVSDSLSRSEPAVRPAPAPAPPAEPAVPPVAEPAATTEPSEGESRPEEATPSPPETEASTAAPAAVAPAKKDAKSTPPKAAPATEPVPPARAPIASPAAPSPSPPPGARAAPAAASPEPSTPDRWAQFAEELRKCQGESFLNRVICDQRVRLRFCEGYWNKVPQCPGAASNPDR